MSLWTIVAYGLTCGYPEFSQIALSESVIPAPNQWQGSIQVGRMMSSCRPGGASEEAEILNQRKSTALVAGTGAGTSMEWSLTSMRDRILVKGVIAGRANVAERQGHPHHVGDTVEVGGAQKPTVRDGDARFDGT